MSETLESALLTLVYLAIVTLFFLITLIVAKTYGWFSSGVQKVEITGLGKEATVNASSADNIYTELAAGKAVTVASENRKAAELTLQAAQAEERTEAMRLERARLEHTDSHA